MTKKYRTQEFRILKLAGTKQANGVYYGIMRFYSSNLRLSHTIGTPQNYKSRIDALEAARSL